MTDIWSYLARDPLLWLTVTVAGYLVGMAVFSFSGKSPLANPALIAMGLIAVLLWQTSTPYETYFEGAQFVHFLLGPATVCLALPLYNNFALVRRSALPILVALVTGSGVAILSVLSIASALGVTGETLASLAPKSATAAVAIGISEQNGGSPLMTTLFVMMTGLTGAAFVTPMLNALRVKDWRARGFATGVAAHGFGTARALQVHPVAGAFAGLGMGLNAFLTAVLAPILLEWFK